MQYTIQITDGTLTKPSHYLYLMVVTKYELAIELGYGSGEWLCNVTVHNENDVLRYEIDVDPPLFTDGERNESFPMEMRYDADGKLVFITEHLLTDDLKDLEEILAREIIDEMI